MGLRERNPEKRIDGIIRWLERMKKSYSSGHVESAYMDAECARADLEDLRSDVFTCIKPERGRHIAPMILRTSIISLLAVMLTASPLSRNAVGSGMPVHEELVIAEPVHEAPATVVNDYPVQPKPKARRPEPKPKVRRTALKPKPKPAVQSAERTQLSVKPVKTVAHDKIYALVQTGQRAMKNDKSVIKVK